MTDATQLRENLKDRQAEQKKPSSDPANLFPDWFNQLYRDQSAPALTRICFILPVAKKEGEMWEIMMAADVADRTAEGKLSVSSLL